MERIVVTVQGESERVEVQLHWIGGHETRATITRPVARLEQLSTYPQLMARVAALHAQGTSAAAIAGILNVEGWHPAKRCVTFHAAMVETLLLRQGLRSQRSAYVDRVEGADDEWTLAGLARHLAIPEPTLYHWLRQGQLQGRQVRHANHPLWLIRADAVELERLRAMRAKPRAWSGVSRNES